METFNVFEPLQRVVAVDEDVNLYDPNDVNWAITTCFNPDRDLILMKDQAGHMLNPMVNPTQLAVSIPFTRPSAPSFGVCPQVAGVSSSGACWNAFSS